MASVKTAISMDAGLFKEVDRLSRKLRVPRSRICARALREFVRKYESRELLKRINEAYRDGPDADEKRTLEAMRRISARAIRETW